MSTQSADFSTVPATIAVPPADAIPMDVIETAARLGVLQHLAQVIELTREIYGGFSGVSVSIDPEIPEATHIVFRVLVDCSIEKALDMDLEWGRRLHKIIPRCPRVYMTWTDFQS
jgi:hypothetical protein